MSEVNLDLERHKRLGFSEAIYCAGKSHDQIEIILSQAPSHGGKFLLTRLADEKFARLSAGARAHIDYDPVSQTGFYGSVATLASTGSVAILTAGTSDVPVAREAQRTLAYYGVGATDINDIGVAGLWRLTEKLDVIRGHRIVIAVAGMDAALVSVVGGLVSSIVIAVPTSVGYGVATGGSSALHSCLASCAPGITVVNIDNGYGAACAALRILNST